jgi:hypothetical protein
LRPPFKCSSGTTVLRGVIAINLGAELFSFKAERRKPSTQVSDRIFQFIDLSLQVGILLFKICFAPSKRSWSASSLFSDRHRAAHQIR